MYMGWVGLGQEMWTHVLSLDDDAMKTLVHAFVISRVDYCNAVLELLAGSPKSTTDTLQRVLNAAARLVSKSQVQIRVNAAWG